MLVPIPEVREVKVDPVLTTCEPEPLEPPAGTDYQTFLGWIEAVRSAGDDCRLKNRCIARQQAGQACRLAE